jgi:hypothetical protein
MTSQQTVQGAAQAVQIGADVGCTRVFCLFGSAIIRRAHVGAGLRKPFFGFPLADDLGQSEIQDLDLVFQRQHEVLRLDVAVDHAAVVGVLQA